MRTRCARESQRDRRGHFVCDNLFAHDTDDVHDWLEDHPHWQLHFTPKHASWLKQIECAFSLFARHVLARGSFDTTDELTRRSYQCLSWFNALNQPAFEWS